MSSSTTPGFADLVFSDLSRIRPGSRRSWVLLLLRIPNEPSILASLLVRAQQCLFHSGHPRLAGALRTAGNVLVGADFGAGMTIGRGLVLMHPAGVTMGFGARLGDDVTLASGVVLAARYYDSDHEEAQEFPTVGSHVTIGAHAVLVGGVTIGDHAAIGANSVVLKDVPAHAVVLGSPAKQVGTRAT